MDERSRMGLEFNGILDLLEGAANTSLSREQARRVGPVYNLEQVQEALAEAAEAKALLERGEEPPFGGVTDIRPHLDRARIEGAALDPRSLWQVYETLGAACQLRAFFHREKDRSPLLWKQARGLLPPESLVAAISGAITPEGAVADMASPGVHRVRQGIRALRGTIVAKLERYLTSPNYQAILAELIVTLRNDRYVIPVKSSAQGRIPGIIQDQSGSGITVYLEPTPVVEMNNRLRSLLREEEEEVIKVLQSLTAQVGREDESIQNLLGLLGHLDFLTAKGRLAVRLGADVPRVTRERRLVLHQARHPFLVLSVGQQGTPVPVDLEVGGAFSVLVITGPNTGGKTVALKTAGLLTLMTLSGLPIPASPDSQIPCYRAVFADIGDEQSIKQSLSTFSSHMTQVIKILAHAGPETLILLDELGAGTDPSEGAALGIAILGALRERGASVIATTHLEAVKAFAALTPGVENASVEFDLERLTPAYHVRLGLPGKSYGLEIAGRLGLPEKVLEGARGVLTDEHRSTQAFLAALEVDRREVDALQACLRHEVAQAKILKGEVEKLLALLHEGMKELAHRARGESKQLLAELRRRGEGLIQALRDQGGRREEIRTFHREIEELKAKAEANDTPRINGPGAGAEIGPGRWVRVAGLHQEGRVLTSVSSQGTVEVQLNVGRVRLPVTALTPAPHEPREEVLLFVQGTESLSPEINLVGCTVDESTQRLEKYLDAAFVGGLRHVRVIHGKGTGMLRNGIHTFLRGHTLVERFHLAEIAEGGRGATVVALKER